MKNKIKVDRERISSEEIASRMDFNQLLSNFPGFAKPPFYKTGWFITTVASVSILIGITTIMLLTNKESAPATVEITELSSPPENTENSAFTYSEDSPCINPPSKHLDIPSSVYKVNSTEETSFQHHESQIKIPANAFIDEHGNPLEGEIEIHYREFHDAGDFLVSGFPMTYDSAGQEYTFESAGMIEIYGYQNGQPVFIAPEKSIRVELAPKNGSSRFNLYELDTTNGKWNYKGKPELVHKDVDESTGEVEYEIQEEIIQYFTYVPESSMMQRLNTLQTQYKVAKEDRIAYEKTAPEKPKTSQYKDRQFQLDVDPSEFPELKAYSQLSFEVDINDTRFSDEVYQIEWEDVSLKEKEKGKTYYMTLFKGAANRTYLVHPVFEGANMKIAMDEFEKSFSVYEKELDKRKTKETEAKKEYEKQLAIAEKARQVEEDEQKEIEASRQQMQELWKAQQQNNKVKNVVARAFNVTQFGTWNCDSPVAKPKGVALAAIFATIAGKILDLKHINLIEKKKNAIFTYDATQFDKLKYNPNETNTLVAFVDENQLAIFKSDRFSEVDNKKKFTFKMEVINVKSLKLEHIKEMLDL